MLNRRNAANAAASLGVEGPSLLTGGADEPAGVDASVDGCDWVDVGKASGWVGVDGVGCCGT